MASHTPAPTPVSPGSPEAGPAARPTIEIAIELIALEPQQEEEDVACFLAESTAVGSQPEVDPSAEGAWSWNLETNELELSPSWQRMLGLWDGQLGASPDEWFSRIHAEDLPAVMRAVDEQLGGGGAGFELEYRIRHADGDYRRVQARATVERDGSGSALRVAGCQRLLG